MVPQPVGQQRLQRGDRERRLDPLQLDAVGEEYIQQAAALLDHLGGGHLRRLAQHERLEPLAMQVRVQQQQVAPHDRRTAGRLGSSPSVDLEQS